MDEFITTLLNSGVILEIAIFVLAITGNKKSAEELRKRKQARLQKKSIKCVSKAKEYAQKAEKLEEEMKNASSVSQ